jgi:hypothetical protein
MRQGLTRVASAPAVLAGAIAVLWWLEGPWDTRTAIAAFLLSAFLSGGIVDRYARGRPTRARGFFGACGAHSFAMVRLGLLVVLAHSALHAALASRVSHPAVMVAAVTLVLGVALIGIYAQIRVVVEDRRSAVGALLAGWRFVRRNPSSILIFLVFAGAMWGASTIASLPVRLPLVAYLGLAVYVSGIALFQSRLAHAGYTAAPPLEWPESPAAEAIANASRAVR